MTIELIYSKASLKFLDNNPSILNRDDCDLLLIKAVKKIYKISIESIDIKRLKGMDSVFRIRKGDIRIIFTLDKDGNVVIASINEIDFRGSVYKK